MIVARAVNVSLENVSTAFGYVSDMFHRPPEKNRTGEETNASDENLRPWRKLKVAEVFSPAKGLVLLIIVDRESCHDVQTASKQSWCVHAII